MFPEKKGLYVLRRLRKFSVPVVANQLKSDAKDFFEHINTMTIKLSTNFYEAETYSTCRSSSIYTFRHLYQPYTIWTLYDYDFARTTDSQAKLASLLFQKIALIVLESTQNRVEPYMEKKTLGNFCGKGRELANTIEEILKLFGKNDRIKIIENKNLDIHLRTANEIVKERLNKRFFQVVQNCIHIFS